MVEKRVGQMAVKKALRKYLAVDWVERTADWMAVKKAQWKYLAGDLAD